MQDDTFPLSLKKLRYALDQKNKLGLSALDYADGNIRDFLLQLPEQYKTKLVMNS